MLRSRIVPFLLLRGRGLVKTQKFGDPKYVGDPMNAVKIFNEKEVDELALLDITATAEKRGPDLELLRKIANESRMPLSYGGGVNDAELAAKIISIGFEKVSISAGALARPELISEMADRIGSQSVVVTLDIKRDGLMNRPTLYTHNGSRKVKQDPVAFAQEAQNLGAGEIVLNSIDRDGMMNGYDLKMVRKVREVIDIPMTVVGGAGSLDHMQELTDEFSPIGVGAGSFFVFKGPYRAVLISYARP